MKQPEQWSRYAERILATGERPHFAPEPETLEVHARLIAGARERCVEPPQVLVLGATPELADLALDQGCRVIRMDCNPSMFAAAERRQIVTDRSGERCVVGDWLDMPGMADASIDLVLGDASLNNVAHAAMPRLIDQLRRITRPGGALSLRQLTLMDGAAAAHPVSRTARRFRDGELSAHVFGKLLRFCCFTDELFDPLERLIDASRVFARIEQSHREGLLTDEEMAFMNGRRSAIQHTLYPSAEQRAWFERIGPCRVENACTPSDHQHLFDVWVIRRQP